ncbi:MAG: PEP-utilizing enzyme [Caldilineaceae bacterium]
MAATQPIPGQPIPFPPDFQITWREPAHSGMFWMRDIMHFPYQFVPLAMSFLETVLNPGMNFGAAKREMPVRFLWRVYNTWAYNTTLPVLDADGKPVQPPADADPTEHPMFKAVINIANIWEEELLPEIRQILAHCEAIDLAAATPEQMISHFDDFMAQSARAWQIHFEIAHPMLVAMSLLDDFCRDVFAADSFGAYRLMQGLDNKSLETDRRMFALSRKALHNPAVMTILQTTAPEQVVAALRAAKACQPFVQELDLWLQEYGQRGDMYDTLTSISWIEEPTPAIRNLQEYIQYPDDIDAHRQALVAERERLIEEARTTLASYPEAVRMQFEALLHSGQAACVIQEDHNYWLDQRANYQLRRLFLEAGNRLAANASIAEPLDVFYLHFEEVRSALLALLQQPQNLQERIAERKATLAHFATIQPPMVIGTMPAAPPPDDPGTRAAMRFFGTPPQPSADPNTINGAAGSPGKITGKAKVVRTLSEAGKLNKGDILVTETTAPPWTPLFATAAAIVTDAGGILSHCAVVAREYAIPAVVGTYTATHLIHDDMQIEVDGSNGTVRILNN